MIDFGFFRLAKSASTHSNHRYQMGCAISVHGKAVSVGFNFCKTHPQHTTAERPSIHAEVSAVIHAQCNISGGTAWVYRETRNGKLAMAKPCERCQMILQEAGIKKVFYTTTNGWEEMSL